VRGNAESQPTPSTTPSIEFPALGTTALVATLDPDNLPNAVHAVRREVAAIDAACSRFRADSELARVNASAGRFVEISDVLCTAIGAALAAAVSTGGLVDPTVGTSLLTLGYRHDFHSSTPSPEPAFRVSAAGHWREIELDDARRRVRIPEGVRLDLGATAKALAADRAAAAAAGVCSGVLVSLGGDISVAGAAPEAGWIVRVTEDHRASLTAPGQTVSIDTGGLATSSTTVRAWQRGGVAVHHIVDPATGAPVATTWRTVSVVAATCLDANIAATAAIVLGRGAVEWLTGRALPSRLVHAVGDVVTVAGWPDDPENGQR
jgi:thiamine biosynthesis lipoprotein